MILCRCITFLAFLTLTYEMCKLAGNILFMMSSPTWFKGICTGVTAYLIELSIYIDIFETIFTMVKLYKDVT